MRGRAPPSYLGAPSLPYSSHFRRSLPNMSAAPPPTNLTEPGKAYPYHLLLISNYRLPNGVDRLNLEVSIKFLYSFYILKLVRIINVVVNEIFVRSFVIFFFIVCCLLYYIIIIIYLLIIYIHYKIDYIYSNL